MYRSTQTTSYIIELFIVHQFHSKVTSDHQPKISNNFYYLVPDWLSVSRNRIMVHGIMVWQMLATIVAIESNSYKPWLMDSLEEGREYNSGWVMSSFSLLWTMSDVLFIWRPNIGNISLSRHYFPCILLSAF